MCHLLTRQAVQEVDPGLEVPGTAIVVGDHDEPILATVMDGDAGGGTVVPIAEPDLPNLGQLG
jgi:hypothetical protein